jgi:hypothetical protein
MIGYKPDLKSLGKRSALNAHAAFDVAGAGNTIGQIGAPVFDPTRERFRGATPLYLLDQIYPNPHYTMTSDAQARVLQPVPATVPALQNTCFFACPDSAI